MFDKNILNCDRYVTCGSFHSPRNLAWLSIAVYIVLKLLITFILNKYFLFSYPFIRKKSKNTDSNKTMQNNGVSVSDRIHELEVK